MVEDAVVLARSNAVNRLPKLAVALLLVTSFSACVGQESTMNPLIIARPPTAQDVMSTGDITGRLVVETCVRISVEPNAASIPIVWPSGTTWNEPLRAVVLEDGTTVKLETWIEGTGGYSSVGSLSNLIESAQMRDALACINDQDEQIVVLREIRKVGSETR